MLRAAALAAVAAGLFASRSGGGSPVASFNDNRYPAGTRSGAVLRVSLEVRLADWRPLGADREGAVVPVFAESGKPAQIPGPLLRVPLGTEVRATITNRLAAGGGFAEALTPTTNSTRNPLNSIRTLLNSPQNVPKSDEFS